MEMYLKGKAVVWFHGFITSSLNADWELFSTEVCRRFTEGICELSSKISFDFDEFGKTKASIIVKDTNVVFAALAASFYKCPTSSISVIGITKINRMTTIAYLIKGMYEAIRLRTRMLSNVAYYVHGKNKLEPPNITPDAILVQKLMAKVVHNDTEVLIMKASHGLTLGRDIRLILTLQFS